MTARLPRIGRLALTLAALTAGVGCAVHEYNPDPIVAEADVLTDVTQLTAPTGVDGFDRAGQGRLSPDERWIVFRGTPRGETAGDGLFVARVRWSGDRGSPDRHVVALERSTRITRPGCRVGGACFSPDHFALAFSASPGPSRPDHPAPMRLFRVDSWEQDVSMTDAARGVDLAQHPITPDDLATDECDWCPDGKTICLAATPNGGPVGLYAIQPNGSHLVRIAAPVGYARGPAFSPDGHRLAYRGDAAGRPTASEIFAADLQFDANGAVSGLTKPVLLTHESGARSTGPCWLGMDHVLYATTRHGDANAELYVMDAAGQRKTRLTISPGPDLLPNVSSDGHHLLWTRAGAIEAPAQLFAAELELPPGS